jgi:hypothetical protein
VSSTKVFESTAAIHFGADFATPQLRICARRTFYLVGFRLKDSSDGGYKMKSMKEGVNAGQKTLKALYLAGLMGLGILVLSPAWASPVIYSQPSDFPGGTVFASQNDPGGFGAFATSYDDFTLTGPAIVDDVHWQGGYFNPGTQGTITSFTITFWSDNAGQPGAQLLSETIPGTANETFVGNQFFGPVYNYSVNLSVPFLATGGTQYWLSIVPTMTLPPQWGWHTGTGGDGLAYQDFFGDRTALADVDFAYDLTGTAVPEPASLGLVGLAILALTACLRRRSRQTVRLT